MSITCNFTVNTGASQIFHGYLLSKDGFYYFRAGDKHFGDLVDHEHKIGKSR